MKLHCPPSLWERKATKAALEAGLNPVEVLAGSRTIEHITIRWKVWRELSNAGYSYFSIGKASGFDHTSVRHAHICARKPRGGSNPLAHYNLPMFQHLRVAS
jgi:hypothetical protein